MLPQAYLQRLRQEFAEGFSSVAPADLEEYGWDWTKLYPPKPSLICFPRETTEVAHLARLCSEFGVALVPSGGRTGLAGGAVATNGEVVVSLVKMRRLGDVDTLSNTLRVQAGAVTEAVHHHCEKQGLTWPIDFASKGSSTVGGNIATNAGGVKVIRYGLTRAWVLGLQVVTMSGEVLELNGALEKNNTGLDLRQLFIGTEGTLGIITEATLKLAPMSGELDVFFFALKDLDAAVNLFHAVRRSPFSVMAFECLSKNCLETVVAQRSLAHPFAQSAGGSSDEVGAYVLLEIERSDLDLSAWLTGLFENTLVLDGVLAQSKRQATDLWSLREGTPESLMQKNFVHKNDVSVPISSLKPFVHELIELFKNPRHGFELYLFGHLGDGNLHLNTMKPDNLDKNEFTKRCEAVDEELFALVQKYTGSVSAEHGIGLLKKEALHYSRTPQEMALLKGVKSLLDPKGLLNPGKIF
ncbi:FAD-binding oxidoreductase [Bdellovibrionota bacterium FG-2]